MSKKKLDLEESQISTETESSSVRSARRQAIVIGIIEIVQFFMAIIYLLLLFLFQFDQQSCVLARVIISAVLAISWGIILSFDVVQKKKGLAFLHIIDIIIWLWLFSFNCSYLTF